MSPEAKQIDWLRTTREHELGQVVSCLKRQGCDNGALLEIGAGAGAQARCLRDLGYDVTAIDIPSSNYAQFREFPIIEYDGVTLPFPDGSFDIVFTSNLLEHILKLDDFEREIRRVLRSGGVVVHVVPNAFWRIGTSLAYYPHLARRAVALLFGAPKEHENAAGETAAPARPSLFSRLAPPRHGERGNAATEMFTFAERTWKKHFLDARWTLIEIVRCELFYTGYMVLMDKLPIRRREMLGRMGLGVSTIFVLRDSDR